MRPVLKRRLVPLACLGLVVGCGGGKKASPDSGIKPLADAHVLPDGRVIEPPDAQVLPDGRVIEPPDASTDTTCPSLPNMKLVEVGRGFTQPLYVTAPPDDPSRLFVVEKRGLIKLLKGGSREATEFMDMTGPVYMPAANSEGGLLGLAFHPQFTQNRRFWLHYTADADGSLPNGHVAIIEYRAATGLDRAESTTPVKKLVGVRHGGWNHCGGMIAFGKDGYLYAAIGDAAESSPNPAQNLGSKLGKILRLDVDNHPTAPPGNMTGDGADPYIWAYGLRNPWRFSFDRETGDLYISDVGHRNWEEINIEPSGTGKRNYGWDIMEGTHCHNSSTCTQVGVLPAIEHETSDMSAVIGGYVYRGSKIPCLRGTYVYGDYGSGRMYALRWNGASVTSKVEITQNLNSSALAPKISSLGEDAGGELYVVSYGNGVVYRIEAE
ncbi:MAG: PQQ-dependent sugar dehydrogenase [Deltaproteobacteria bacterium]|nr:PQQ-dependent sugar dehydrogenase [Deltaproteobacteria bacterium]